MAESKVAQHGGPGASGGPTGDRGPGDASEPANPGGGGNAGEVSTPGDLGNPPLKPAANAVRGGDRKRLSCMRLDDVSAGEAREVVRRLLDDSLHGWDSNHLHSGRALASGKILTSMW